MKYKFIIRRISDGEIGPDCPFFPDEEEFEMYLDAFKEEVVNIAPILSVAQEAETIIFELESDSDVSALQSDVKKLFQTGAGTRFRSVTKLAAV